MSELLITKLLKIEAWADGLREECRKTRKLIEERVSTSTKSQKKQALNEKQITALLARKNSRLFKAK